MRVSRERFYKLVEEALDGLPREFRRHMRNVEVVIEDHPPRELGIPKGEPVLGLYQGVPLCDRSVMASGTMPDIIFLFRRNIGRICSSEEEIRTEVRDTVLHEIGHHFGLDEEELEDI